MARTYPAPEACDTAEEQRAYFSSVEDHEADLAHLARDEEADR